MNQSKLRISIRRPVTVIMLFLGMIVFGVKSYKELSLNLLPDISYPTLTIRTEYPEAAPEEVENFISRPVEEALSTVDNLVEISSISSAGISEVILEFTWDTDMDFAGLDVREKLDRINLPEEAIKPTILRYNPALDPILRVGIYGGDTLYHTRELAEEEIKPELEGIPGVASVRVKGGLVEEIFVELDVERLTQLGVSINKVAQRLRQENINLASGSLKEGKAEYLVRTLNEFRTLEEIGDVVVAGSGSGVAAIASGMAGLIGGEEAALGMADEAAGVVRLRDVARIVRGHRKREVITRINGSESVEIEIYKEADSNTVTVANLIKARLGVSGDEEETSGDGGRLEERTIREAFEFLGFELISDQSRFIENALDEVKMTALLGGILALVILFVFLADARSTFIIGLSIPVSIVATFVPMFSLDVSLNIMSLGGLALGIGMLVDNSIVVLESIFRCREEGDDIVTAANRGTGEVASAITASTLTTIAVFFPIVFVKGIAGKIFNDLAWTVTFSLLASLIVAVYLIPMIASRKWGGQSEGPDGEPAEDVPAGPDLAGRVSELSAAGLGRQWAETVRIRRDRPWPLALLALPFMVLLFVVTVVLKVLSLNFTALSSLGVNVFRRGAVSLLVPLFRAIVRPVLAVFNAGYGAVYRRYPDLLKLALRHRLETVVILAFFFALALLAISGLGSELIPRIHQGEFSVLIERGVGTPLDDTYTSVLPLETIAIGKEGTDTVFTEVGSDREHTSTSKKRGEHSAMLTIAVSGFAEDILTEDRVIDDLRKDYRDVVDMNVEFVLPTIFSFKTPVEVEIEGQDLEVLKEIGKRTESAMREVPGLHDVKVNLSDGNPEIRILFDRDRMAWMGLDLHAVADTIKNKVLGTVPTRYSQGEKRTDIRLRADRLHLNDVEALKAITVNPESPVPVPLSAIAEIVIAPGPSEIRRVDQRRVALVTANLSGVDLGTVSEAVMERLESIEHPPGYRISMGGQNKEMQTSFRSLQLAFLLAIFLVYIVMASQFESLLHPFVILFSLPLGLIGVALTLYVLAIPLSIVVFIGLIVLAGIMVNNAIVLVDYINVLRRRGMARDEAIVQAGMVRFRPMLMTTMTTILGLLPMAVGTGEGAEIRAPMAVTVIAGLAASTLLTLVGIPVIYSLLDRLGRFDARAA